MRCRSVLLMCSSVLGTEVTQSDRSSVTSVLGQFGPQKRTEVTEDRSGCRAFTHIRYALLCCAALVKRFLCFTSAAQQLAAYVWTALKLLHAEEQCFLLLPINRRLQYVAPVVRHKFKWFVHLRIRWPREWRSSFQRVRFVLTIFGASLYKFVCTLCLRKKQDTKLLPITSPNGNRFSKFFHWQTHW